MKSVLLASALVFGLGGAAFAADAVVDDVVVVDTAYNWSGVYLGVQAGYGWADTEYSHDDSAVGFDFDGFVGGLTAGVNWQQDSFVFGLEADISYSDVDGGTRVGDQPCVDEACSADIEWFGTARGRLGYAFNNILPYVTGGFAFGRVQGAAESSACGMVTSCTYNDTEFGWTAGLGVEWGLTQQISLKTEYMHVDFGTPDFSNDGGDATVEGLSLDTVRVGLNYRF